RDGGEVARSLTSEYGRGTGLGFLNGLAASGRSSRRKMNVGLIQRLRGFMEAVKTRVVHAPAAEIQQELRLLAQWKRAELATTDLVDRLEELEFESSVAGLDLCLRSSPGRDLTPRPIRSAPAAFLRHGTERPQEWSLSPRPTTQA